MALPITGTQTNTISTAFLGDYLFQRKVADQVFSSSKLLMWLRKNAIEPMDLAGGDYYKVNARNSLTGKTAYMRVGGTNQGSGGAPAQMNAQIVDTRTYAQFPAKFLSGTATFDQVVLLRNKGNLNKIIDITAETYADAIDDLSEQIAQGVALGAADPPSSATGDDKMGGLRHLINVSPASQTDVGGISRASNSWWRNKSYGIADLSTELASPTTFTTALVECMSGHASPEVWFMDKTTFANILAFLSNSGSNSIVTYSLNQGGEANFIPTSLNIAGLPAYADEYIQPFSDTSGYGGDADVGVIFLFSSNSIKLAVNEDKKLNVGDDLFVQVGIGFDPDEAVVPDQMVKVAKVYWDGSPVIVEPRATAVLGIEAF